MRYNPTNYYSCLNNKLSIMLKLIVLYEDVFLCLMCLTAPINSEPKKKQKTNSDSKSGLALPDFYFTLVLVIPTTSTD